MAASSSCSGKSELLLSLCRQLLETWPQYAGRLLIDGSGRPAIHVPVFQVCTALPAAPVQTKPTLQPAAL